MPMVTAPTGDRRLSNDKTKRRGVDNGLDQLAAWRRAGLVAEFDERSDHLRRMREALTLGIDSSGQLVDDPFAETATVAAGKMAADP
jgi:hypothetical protein